MISFHLPAHTLLAFGWPACRRCELKSPQASKTELGLVQSAINNQKTTGLCGPMGDHKRPLWTVGAEGRCRSHYRQAQGPSHPTGYPQNQFPRQPSIRCLLRYELEQNGRKWRRRQDPQAAQTRIIPSSQDREPRDEKLLRHVGSEEEKTKDLSGTVCGHSRRHWTFVGILGSRARSAYRKNPRQSGWWGRVWPRTGGLQNTRESPEQCHG